MKKCLTGPYKKYTGSDYTKESKDDVKPYLAKPFPIPNIHEPTLKKRIID